MKLATFEAGGQERLGVVKGAELIDLTPHHLAADMTQLIANWDALKDEVAAIAADDKPDSEIGEVHL